MALISTVDQIKQYVAVNLATNIDSILPYITQAELKFIKPLIGKQLYEDVLEYVEDQDSESDNDALDELLDYIRRPLAHYAYYLYVPVGNVQLSDRGIHISTDETKKTAFEWQIDQLRESFINTAHDFSETLLEWLEEYINEQESDSAGEGNQAILAWVNSDAYTEAKGLFINKASEFNEQFYINNSRRLFVILRPIIKSIELKYVRPIISITYYDELKNEILNRNISSDNQVIIDLIKSAVAHLTVARAISELAVEILPQGVFENWKQATLRAAQPARRDNLAVLKANLQADGEAELKAVQEYLDANASASKYKTYYESDRYYEDSDETTRGEFDNESDNKIFVA